MSRTRLILLFSILILVVVFFKTNSVQQTAKEESLVPNVIHFALLKEDNITETKLEFIGATCILAAFLNQDPEKVVIHTNVKIINGRYFNIVKSVIPSEKLEIRFEQRPTHVYGYPLSSLYHSADVLRISTLLHNGGIFLDLDTFIVRPLNIFFINECTIGWPKGQNIGTQIVIAKPKSRFLSLWLKSYKDYRASMWYYNAGEAPTKEILNKDPNLVNRITELFGVHNLAKELYDKSNWKNWTNYYSIHLLSGHRNYLVPLDVKESGIVQFDEFNIQFYKKPFGEIARSIWNNPLIKKHWESKPMIE